MGLGSPVEADIDVERRYLAWANVVREVGERDDTRVLFVFFVRPSIESETPLRGGKTRWKESKVIPGMSRDSAVGLKWAQRNRITT